MDAPSTIGSKIRAAREQRGLTQTQLATLVGATSNMAVSRWEHNKFAPSATFAAALSRVLGLPISDLVEARHAATMAADAAGGE